jgi:hypothetical protein
MQRTAPPSYFPAERRDEFAFVEDDALGCRAPTRKISVEFFQANR